MRFLLLATIKVLLLGAVLLTPSGQEHKRTSPKPVVVSEREASHHLISPWPRLRVNPSLAEKFHFSGLRIHVTVDATGAVASAVLSKEQYGEPQLPAEVYDQAVALVRGLRFKPVERSDEPVAFEFDQYVSLLPPEIVPSRHVPFPEVKDLKSVKITLSRSSCFGSCPEYEIVVHGDGKVEYNGKYYVALTGHHVGSAPKASIQELLDEFKAADYFSLNDEYKMMVTDNPTYTTSVEIQGKRKQVSDYVGIEIGMPLSVQHLEDEIDRLSGSERWVKGNADTVAALKAEHWDFKSPEATMTLLRIVQGGNVEAVRDLVSAGVPLAVKRGPGPAPKDATDDFWKPTGPVLVAAASRGDMAILNALLNAGAGADGSSLDSALLVSAESGSVDVFQLLMQNGARLDACDDEGRTVLMCAAASGSPALVEEVLKHGADVNAVVETPQLTDKELMLETRSTANIPDLEGRTALMEAASQTPYGATPAGVDRAEVVRILLDAGADPNARDKYGDTALISCARTGNVPSALVLIKAGANVNAKNDQGQSPLSAALEDDMKRLLIAHGAGSTDR